jgi:hypothetical protein
VVKAASETRTADTRERLLGDLGEMHEEFLKKMMELSRHVTDLEDRSSRATGTSPPRPTS